jgi:threo-3-hydroxy-L-aspartate ammonia-lyase
MTPTYADVVEAAARLKGHAHRTPVHTSATLNAEIGAEVFLKCENLQRMGAFKFRGAFNAIAKLSAEQRAKGVLAFSSGNHAQAIALSAREMGVKAVILMPEDAPAAKVSATKGYGAQVIHYNRYTQDRAAISQQIANDRGLTLIPPYEHADVIAGAGTAAKELIEEVGALDAIFICLGGGGFTAGVCLAVKALSPQCKIYPVEPEAGNDGQQSFRSGSIVKIDTPITLADGAQTQSLGGINFDIIRRDATDVLTATDEQLVQCMRFMAERMKMVVEPTGVLGLAAARFAGIDLKGKRVGIMISGGNVDLAAYAKLIGTT